MNLKEDFQNLLVKFGLTESDIVEETKEEKVEFNREKFEDVALLDGSVIMVEPAVEAGAAAVVMNEDVPVPLPVGEYELEDGRIIVVEEAGVVAAVNEAATEEAVEEGVEEELATEDTEKKREAKKVIESIVTEKVFSETVAKFEKQINDLTDALSVEKAEKVEFMKEVKELFAKLLEDPKEEPVVKKHAGFKKEKKNYFLKN
jgi:hypothetical protein